MISDYNCRLCDTKCSSLSILAKHLKKYHDIVTEEDKHAYYDLYYKQPEEGLCLICGKPTKFQYWKYKNFCSRSCQLEYTRPQMLKTMKERYGAEYAAQSDICRAKMEQTCLDRYNVRSCWWTEESKQKAIDAHTKESRQKQIESTKKTMKERYGVSSNFCRREVIVKSHSKEANEKRRQTNKKKYGVDYIFQSEEYKNKLKTTMLEKYNVENPWQLEKVQQHKNSPEARRKAAITMRKNGHKSKAEDILAKCLIDNNIDYLTEYSSEKYPYNCDFYLPKYDLYIELNIFPMHNGHFYDKSNKEDKKMLKNLKRKAKTSDWYKKMIEVWTIRDVSKKECAINNNLNYIVIWTYEELASLINMIIHYKRKLKNYGQKF